jgi:enoyl reductase-like protein
MSWPVVIACVVGVVGLMLTLAKIVHADGKRDEKISTSLAKVEGTIATGHARLEERMHGLDERMSRVEEDVREARDTARDTRARFEVVGGRGGK